MLLCGTCHRKTGCVCRSFDLHPRSRGPCGSCGKTPSRSDFRTLAKEFPPANNEKGVVLRVRLRRAIRSYLASNPNGPYPNLDKALNDLPTPVLFDLDALLCHVDPKGIRKA